MESSSALYGWGHALKGLSGYTSQPCLVNGSPFKVNVKPTGISRQKLGYFWPPCFGSEHYVIVFCSFTLGWNSKKSVFFFNLWERLLAACKSRYRCHISKTWVPNSLGLWYTQMVFLFCISANAVTKYNNFSSKVIRAHLAPSLIYPTCYLLITLRGGSSCLVVAEGQRTKGLMLFPSLANWFLVSRYLWGSPGAISFQVCAAGLCTITRP